MMGQRPTVSVVVPAFNSEATLRACLQSLLQLECPDPDVEFLVVDNASRDHTRAVIESFAPRVQYHLAKKRGPAAARNCGIAHARGEIVAFTDADCVVEPQWLSRLIEPLRDENVGIVGGAIRSVSPSNAVEMFGERIHDQQKAICVYKPAYVAAANWASPRQLLTGIGMFDENLRGGEDTDLAWRTGQAGRQLVYQPAAIVYHRHERTVRGLFREGFQHGFHSVLVNRKHQAFLKEFGYRRLYRHSYVRLLASLREYLATRSTDALCDFAFNSGKKLGKFAGSARAGYMEL